MAVQILVCKGIFFSKWFNYSSIFNLVIYAVDSAGMLIQNWIYWSIFAMGIRYTKSIVKWINHPKLWNFHTWWCFPKLNSRYMHSINFGFLNRMEFTDQILKMALKTEILDYVSQKTILIFSAREGERNYIYIFFCET